jgi:predicted dehydrogenase
MNGKRVLSGDQFPSNYTLQLKEFVSALREGRRPKASGEEVLKTQILLDAARQAEREKRPVYLSP